MLSALLGPVLTVGTAGVPVWCSPDAAVDLSGIKTDACTTERDADDRPFNKVPVYDVGWRGAWTGRAKGRRRVVSEGVLHFGDVTRRSRPPENEAVYKVGDVELDVARHRVTLGGQPIRLSPKEFDLLRMLVVHAGRVVTHKQLLCEIWGRFHENDTQYLRVYVGQLREKLGDDPARPRYIANEPGIGYRFSEPD